MREFPIFLLVISIKGLICSMSRICLFSVKSSLGREDLSPSCSVPFHGIVPANHGWKIVSFRTHQKATIKVKIYLHS